MVLHITADILENGITLTGGGALIRNIDKAIENEIGVPVRIANEPLDCVVLGTGMAADNDEIITRSAIGRRIN